MYKIRWLSKCYTITALEKSYESLLDTLQELVIKNKKNNNIE